MMESGMGAARSRKRHGAIEATRAEFRLAVPTLLIIGRRSTLLAVPVSLRAHCA